jgi:hypothetical protein
MSEKKVVFGNYLVGGGCVCIEDNLSLRKIHEIVNHWTIHEGTGELFKFSNETRMIFLEEGLVLFYHLCESYFDDEIAKCVPSISIEGNDVFGTYVITRYENGEFINLTETDILRLEKCQYEADKLRKKELEKRRNNK